MCPPSVCWGEDSEHTEQARGPKGRRACSPFSDAYPYAAERPATHRSSDLARRVYNHANPLLSLPHLRSSPGGHMAKTGPLVTPATILIVDDSADTRAVLRRMLAFRGYHVVEASDGREAVEAGRSDCPDLVVMDLNMPVMDGLAATERIRELRDRCGDVPIVAATAFDTYGIREAAMEAGCNAYLLKPLDLDEFESVIAGLLSG